jgi:SAM-dependent methyltransferase
MTIMPVLDNAYWQERLRTHAGTRYAEVWRDRYIDVAWKRALRRVFTARRDVRSVLDVGCGDGHIGVWLQRQFGVRVVGVDAYPWEGTSALHAFSLTDVEAPVTFRELVARHGRFDIAMTTTVLAHAANWQAVLANMIETARHIVILENLQSPVPQWQRGLSYKRPLPWPELMEVAHGHGLTLEKWLPVTVVDTRLFRRLPAWFAHLATTPLDWAATRWVPPSRARQQICVFGVPAQPVFDSSRAGHANE